MSDPNEQSTDTGGIDLDARFGSVSKASISRDAFPVDIIEYEKQGDGNDPKFNFKEGYVLGNRGNYLVLEDHTTDLDAVIPSGAELWELNTPDVVSSLGRVPVGNPNYNYFPARITEQGIEAYNSPWLKWTNRGVIGVFKATTNLVANPEDLTSGWTIFGNMAASLSDYYIDGKRFTKLLQNGAGTPYIYRDIETTTTTPSIQCVFKRGQGDDSDIKLHERTGGVYRGGINIAWDTDTITVTDGLTNLVYKWISADIVWVGGMANGVVTANDNEILIHPTDSTDTDYVYIAAVQVEDSIYPTPYTPTSRAGGQLDYPLTLTDKFTLIFWVWPWFPFDTGTSHRFIQWRIDNTHELIVYYNPTFDAIYTSWRDGGTARRLGGQQLDDSGTNDVNQWIMVALTADLSAQGQTASRLKVYTIGGSTGEDTDWGGVPNAFTGPFPKMSVGQTNGTSQADSLITDLLFAPSLLDDSVITAHYTDSRPFFANNRLLGENCNFKLDSFGNAYFKNLAVIG